MKVVLQFLEHVPNLRDLSISLYNHFNVYEECREDPFYPYLSHTAPNGVNVKTAVYMMVKDRGRELSRIDNIRFEHFGKDPIIIKGPRKARKRRSWESARVQDDGLGVRNSRRNTQVPYLH